MAIWVWQGRSYRARVSGKMVVQILGSHKTIGKKVKVALGDMKMNL